MSRRTRKPFLHTIPIIAGITILQGCGALGRHGSSAGTGEERLTLEDTLGGPAGLRFGGRLPDWSWAEDGEHLELKKKGPEETERTWYDLATWSTSAAPEEDADGEMDALIEAFQAIDGVDAERAGRIAGAQKDSTEDDSVRVFLEEGELFLVTDAGGARAIGASQALEVELPDLSPDGTQVAYIQSNNLHVIDIATGAESALSSDGSSNVFNGKLDWVYQEEIYGRGDFKGFWWSPDSKHIAFLRLDEAAVHEFTVVDHIDPAHFRVQSEITKYPKVGDPNPTVQVGVLALATPGDVHWVDLASHAESEPLVVRVLWTPDGAHMLYMIQDRTQTWLELVSVDPATGAGTKLLRETSRSWTNRSRPPHWLEDGSFLWLSERTGQRHIEHRGPRGKLLNSVTSGPWSVGSILHVDESAGHIWFDGSRDGAINANTYRVALDGTQLLRLTRGDGQHAVSFNTDHTAFIDRHSSLTSAPTLHLVDGEGTVIRELASADMSEFDRYATSAWQLHEITTRDGVQLDAAVLQPVDFNPRRKYPVWLFTYSGPNAPTVRNRWNSSVWHQFLAQNGVIVLSVNVRSASGKGLESTSLCYRQLGRQELRDLEDAVAWLTDNSWADADRVGMTGHSYGGFMTAFALTHSSAFALGIASSGVYDWRLYDSIYTERYMQTPALNPEGYSSTSVLEAAANLQGHLIVTHGVMDDNVHFQNAVALVNALQQANQPFEFMLYPQARHGIRRPDQRRFARQLAWDAIQKHLLSN